MGTQQQSVQKLFALLLIGGMVLAGYGIWLYRDTAQFTEADIEATIELNTMFDEVRARQSDDPLWRDEHKEDRRERVGRELRVQLVDERDQAFATIFAGLILAAMAIGSMWFGPGRKRKE